MSNYGSQVTAIAGELIESITGSYQQIKSFLLQCGVEKDLLDSHYRGGAGGKTGFLLRILSDLDQNKPQLLNKIILDLKRRLSLAKRGSDFGRLDEALAQNGAGANAAERVSSASEEARAIEPAAGPAVHYGPANRPVLSSSGWEAFICHASEDKDRFVRPLAERLQQEGLAVWYDEWTLQIGDSLRQKIDEGLVGSKYGVVVLSHHFFAKEWPQTELDGLAVREADGQKVILPVWLDVSRDDVVKQSPILAGRLAAKASDGMDKVVEDLKKAMGLTQTNSPTVTQPDLTDLPEVDYWRCPDGKLHQWRYWRGADGKGMYLCENCRFQVDKITLKAHTDQGPPEVALTETVVQTGTRIPGHVRVTYSVTPTPDSEEQKPYTGSVRARILEEPELQKDRPRFRILPGSFTNRPEDPHFEIVRSLVQVSGEPMESVEVRVRSAGVGNTAWMRMPLEYRPGKAPTSPWRVLVPKQPIKSDDSLVPDGQLGFELRFRWRGQVWYELHLFPFAHGNLGAEMFPSLWKTEVTDYLPSS